MDCRTTTLPMMTITEQINKLLFDKKTKTLSEDKSEKCKNAEKQSF
jgi:hypothetical protein